MVRCPACGATADGRYCVECGIQVLDAKCAACGTALGAGARFCNNCGAPVGTAVRAPGAAPKPAHPPVRGIALGALLIVAAFVAGESVSRWMGQPDPQAAAQATSVVPAGMPVAPDISTMTPRERASRLFNRVMSYSERGKTDSVRFFAQMAIQAYGMIGPLDSNARYEVGAIFAAVGDAPTARAQADTILAAQPNDLLGLVLAMRAATLAGDTASLARYRRRLVATAPTERAKGVSEYAEHGRDIDAALEASKPAR